MAVYEEIMQRIRDIYAANHAVGDMALHNIIQFTERKIRYAMQGHAMCQHTTCMSYITLYFALRFMGMQVHPSLQSRLSMPP